MLKFINASISSHRAQALPSPSLKRERFLLGTRIPHVSRGHLAYLNWGGNFLGEASEIFNTESLNISVAAKLCRQAKNCSEKSQDFKAREIKKAVLPLPTR